MKTVGETLRTAREKQQYDLQYVSDNLKIRVKYLDALETGDYSIFSSVLYVKGFLKNYARFLHIDENEVLALYRREDVTPPPVREFLLLGKDKNVIKMIPFSLKPGHIAAFFTVIVVLSISFYLFYEYRMFSAAPSLDVSNPTQGEVVNNPILIVKGHTNPGNRILINNTPIADVTINGDFATQVTLNPDTNELMISAESNVNKTTTVKRTVILNERANQIGTSVNNVMNGLLSITNDRTWVKVIIDGVALINGEVLDPGTKRSFTAKNEIYIQTGRSADTNVSVNAVPIDFSDNGSVTNSRTITIDSAGRLTIK